MQRKNGFTLIELMIVVAIVGILASIAYPSYTKYVRETRRADARTTLLALAGAMERHYTANYNYEGAASGALPGRLPALDSPAMSPPGSANPFYLMVITSAAGATYTIEAQRNGAQANDPCGNFTLNQAGVRGLSSQAASATVQNCW